MRIFVLLPLLIVLGMSFSVAQDAKPELRTWTAVNGKEVEAEFVSNSDGQVSLKMKTGKIFKVPLNKLSKADQEFIKVKSSREQVKLAFVTNAPADYWLYARAGISKAITEFDDIEVEFIVGNGTAIKQREQVEELLLKGVKGIAIAPCNPTVQKEVLNEWAKKATLITVDSDAADTSRKLFLGTDNVAAGRQAGELLKEALPEGGKVMAFVGLGDHANAVERYQGLKEAVAGTKIEILDLRTDEVDFGKARRNAEDTLTKYPDIAGMVGLWSYNAPLILEAVKSKGFLGKVKIIACDDDLRTLKAIDEGGIYGTVVQQPFELGYRSVKALRSLIVEKKAALDLSVIEPSRQFIETLIIGKGQGMSYLQKLQEWKSSDNVPAEAVAISPHLKYEIKDDAVTITFCDRAASGELTIPATIEGKAVTNIGFAAFNRCDSLMRVTIPDTVTSIGAAAFLHCGSLANITIGAGVTYIGDNAFNSCVSLTGITLPDTLTRISEGAFYNCRLTSITIPDGVTSIGEMTFGACRDLTSVTFLGKPPKEGKEVFKDSTPTIYRKPDAKGWGATWGGRPVKLISDKLIAENTPVEPKSFSLHLKYEIKDDAVTITGCDKKASGELTIPATIEGRAVTSIGMDAFTGCTSLKNITLPDGLTSIGDRAFCACKSLTSIIIPDSVTSIGGDAFIGCASLKNITIPDSVTSIGNSAFTGCASLTSITIPDSVNSIGYGVFLLCKSLTSITIPDSVTSIGETAFYGCRSLTSITIPASVTSIGKGAFEDCTDLTAVTFLGDAPKAGRQVFYKATPTIYRKPEAKGWGDTFAGRPVKLISEKP